MENLQTDNCNLGLNAGSSKKQKYCSKEAVKMNALDNIFKYMDRNANIAMKRLKINTARGNYEKIISLKILKVVDTGTKEAKPDILKRQ